MTTLWRICHGSCPVELLTMPSVSFSTQKHSPHCSFEEEHHQIHPTDVSWPSYCYPLHSHADREPWKGWNNAGRPAQRPQKGLLPRLVSQSVHYSTSLFYFVLLVLEEQPCSLFTPGVCAYRITCIFSESWPNLQPVWDHPVTQVLFGAIGFSEDSMCQHRNNEVSNKPTKSQIECLLTGTDRSSSLHWSCRIDWTVFYYHF